MKLEGTKITQEFIDEWAAYESPVKMIVENQEAQFMDGVMKACQTVGIKVNADELINALNYDRMQYYKGFSEGALAAFAKMDEEKARKKEGEG